MCLWSAVSTKQEAPQLLNYTCKINRVIKKCIIYEDPSTLTGNAAVNIFFLSQCWITASLLFPTLPRNLWKLFSPFSHEFQYNVMSPLWLLHQLCLARTWLRTNSASKDDWEKGLDSLSGYVRRAKSVLILKGDNLRIQGIHSVSLQKPNLNLNSWTKFEK